MVRGGNINMNLKTKLRLLVAIGAAAGSLSLGLIAVTGSAGAASTASNTITFAEAPGGFPNYIFPYMSCTYFSVDNTQAFQYEMFRPVYWFGLGTTTVVQPKLSLAAMPVLTK